MGKYQRQYRIILSADTASEVRQPSERCLSRKAGIVRCCLRYYHRIRTRMAASMPLSCAVRPASTLPVTSSMV